MWNYGARSLIWESGSLFAEAEKHEALCRNLAPCVGKEEHKALFGKLDLCFGQKSTIFWESDLSFGSKEHKASFGHVDLCLGFPSTGFYLGICISVWA